MNLKMTVGKKLLAINMASAVLTVAVGVAGYWGIQRVSHRTDKMLKEEGQIAQHSASIRAHTLGLRRYEKDMFINIQDVKKVEDYEKKFNEQHDHLLKRLAALRLVSTLPQDKERVAQAGAEALTK